MSFAWNELKKVELFNVNTKQAYLSKATPKTIIRNPHGFRQDDIIHSLCIAMSEIINMAEATEESNENVAQTLKESVEPEPVKEEVKIEPAFNGTTLTAEDV